MSRIYGRFHEDWDINPTLKKLTCQVQERKMCEDYSKTPWGRATRKLQERC
jgi:hypothetical protein